MIQNANLQLSGEPVEQYEDVFRPSLSPEEREQRTLLDYEDSNRK